MHPELTKRLVTEFPFMEQHPIEKGALYELFYGYDSIGHGNGWFPLLWRLAQDILAVYKRAGLPPDIHVNEICEKWGELSICFEFKNDDPTYTATHNLVLELVRNYERMSEDICERCGLPGEKENGAVRCKRCRQFGDTGLCGPITPALMKDELLCGCPLIGSADGYEFYGGRFCWEHPTQPNTEQYLVFIKKGDHLVAEAARDYRGLSFIRTTLDEAGQITLIAAWELLPNKEFPSVNTNELTIRYDVPLDEILDLIM